MAVLPNYTAVDAAYVAQKSPGAGQVEWLRRIYEYFVLTNAAGNTVVIPTIAWTQTVVALAAATSATLIAANANRKALRWMVSGANPMTVAPGLVAVVASVGMNYNSAPVNGAQGGSDSFAGELSLQAFSAVSALGTTVIIWEGQ